MVVNPFLFLWILAASLDRVSFHFFSLGTLTFRLPMYGISGLSFSSSLGLAAAPEAGFFKLFFTGRDASHDFLLFQVSDHDMFLVWCSLAVPFSEQYLECTEAEMALAVLNVEADGNINSPEFLVGLLLDREDGFIPSHIERMYVVILQLDLQNFIDVQDGFVCVADLEILIDRCDWPFSEKAFFFLSSLFLN